MGLKYAKIGGSNILDGLSYANAWEDPEFGMETMDGGDVLEIGGGTYDWARPTPYTDIPNGTPEAWTIVRNYNSEVVTFHHAGSNAKLLNFESPSRSYEYIEFSASIQDGMIFDMEDQAGTGQCIKYTTPSSRAGTPNKFLRFVNLKLTNSVDSGILGYRSEDIWLINLTCDNNGDSSQDHGAYINDTRCTIQGGRYINNSGWGIQHWSAIGEYLSSDVVIDGPVVYSNGWGGIIAVSGGVGAFTIKNSTVYDHKTSSAAWGIAVYRCNGAKVYHNTCHDNNYGIQVGTSFGGADTADISNNISCGNVNEDIYVWSLSDNVLCKDNRTTKAILNNGPSTTQTRHVTGLSATTEFIESTNADKSLRNYRLKVGATSINPTGVTTVGVGFDAKGTIRPQGGIVDPGMDEFRASLWSPPGPWLDSELDNRTIRFLVRGSDIGDTVSTIKMFLIGRSTGSYTVTGVSIAERDGATLNVVDATNEQVTFGGTWAAGATVPANTEVESDAITIDIAPTKDYFITFHCAAGQPTVYSSTAEGTTSWHMLGVDHTGTLDWGALSIDTTREFPYIAFRLEETVVSPDASAPGIDVILSQTAAPGVRHALNANATDQDNNIIKGYALCPVGNAGFDFDPSGCTVTHKTS